MNVAANQEPEVRALTDQYFEAQRDRNHRRMDRIFAVLMVVQWAAGILIARVISPRSWAGSSSDVHPHLYLAIVGGTLLSSLPIALALLRPGEASTRQVVAIAQMLWSALLIHLTGGRIETHFHVFGSLAFIAFYRDWKLIPLATVVVAADHLLRGVIAPASVYGVLNPEWWRFLEHAFWIAFEDVVLIMSCVSGLQDMRESAWHRAEAEVLSRTLDRRVQERTDQLTQANAQIRESMQKQTETNLRLVEASRKAGMADVATAVLHNVGNVLNSVNVSAGMIASSVQRSRAAGVRRLATLVSQPEIAGFLASHPKTKPLPTYLTELSEAIAAEQRGVVKEVDGLQRNIEHIKVIVTMQQSHAGGGGGAAEPVDLGKLLEAAITMNALSFEKHHVEVVRELSELPMVTLDRHKTLQIIINLLTNARQALGAVEHPQIAIRLQRRGAMFAIEVQDNGCGIEGANLSKVFSQGFTTKQDGHGFGLHSSACAAREMGGNLACRSDGKAQGACFTLELPCRAAQVAA